MAHRVIQWATGSIGRAQLREIIEHPDLELVGVLVYGADKVGVDAGRLCGLADTGVLATNDKDAIVALDAEVVVHAATKYGAVNSNDDDIERLLRSGKNVVTTTTYNHLPTFGIDVERRFAHACSEGGCSFLAAGENPGFMMQRLAMTVTGLSKTVTGITLEEYFEVSWIDSPSMVFDGMMFGVAPEEFTIDAPAMARNSLQYQQELAATAAVLGIELERIEPSIEVTTLDRDLEVAAGVIPARTVVGSRMTWTGYWRGAPYLTIHEYWVMTRDLPQWNLDQIQGWTDRSFIRIRIDGVPSYTLGLQMQLDPVTASTQGTTAEHVMIAMSGVRAIPELVAAPPGIVTAPVFAGYRPY